MTDKEIILLFKKDSGMDEKGWKRFCTRYATRDVFAVMEYLHHFYVPNSHIKTLRNSLKKEMYRVAYN